MSIMSLQFTFYSLLMYQDLILLPPRGGFSKLYGPGPLGLCGLTLMPVLAIGRLQAVETSFHTDVQEKEDGHEG